ncbi:MAG: XrtA/PEP-CTERM system-associated ATPase [Nitrospirota bacterium]
MYTSFFGFKCKPFQLTPDPEFLFMGRCHKRALTYLNYGITENSGFILITGEIGTGKTTIIRSMIKSLKEDIKLARINNTLVTSEQLISMINEDFGLDTRNKDKTRILSELTDFLINQYAQGGRSMIIIDEAQNLSPELLEEIRLLSNLETDKSKLLQIILVGQPELNITLSRPELEQLRQRITINTYISPLSREETEAYIKHRLRVAGNEDGVRFEDGVIDAVYDFSKGIPRLINMLCDFALLASFVDERKTIDMDLIREIMSDLVNERPETRAAALKAEEPLKQDASILLRLQNLEAIIYGNNPPESSHTPLLKRDNPPSPPFTKGGLGGLFDETNRLIAIKEAELKRKEEELLKREYELLKKEDALKKREENIRYLFEQNMKGFSSEKR